MSQTCANTHADANPRTAVEWIGAPQRCCQPLGRENARGFEQNGEHSPGWLQRQRKLGAPRLWPKHSPDALLLVSRQLGVRLRTTGGWMEWSSFGWACVALPLCAESSVLLHRVVSGPPRALSPLPPTPVRLPCLTAPCPHLAVLLLRDALQGQGGMGD